MNGIKNLLIRVNIVLKSNYLFVIFPICCKVSSYVLCRFVSRGVAILGLNCYFPHELINYWEIIILIGMEFNLYRIFSIK